MDIFWKTTAAVLIAAILGLVIGKEQKDMGVLLTIAACAMAIGSAVTYLEPVLDFFWELEALAGLQGNALEILLKALGIGITSEIAGMVCKDAGNASLEKTIHILGGALILYLSLPIFRSVLQLIQEILETL